MDESAKGCLLERAAATVVAVGAGGKAPDDGSNDSGGSSMTS